MSAALKEPKASEKRENYVISDDMEIYGILKSMSQRKEKLWSWQVKNESDSKRSVHYAIIRKVDPIKKTIEIVPNNSSGFRFKPGQDLFLYSTHKGIALKITMREFDPFYITFTTPPRLNVLSKDFLTNIELVEKEDEDSNKHKRNVPRIRPKADQIVTIRKLALANGAMKFYQLYDISQTGMGMVVDDPAEFELMEKVEVLAINNKDLPKILKGEVVAIRQIGEEGSDQFKIGVRFS